MGFSPITGSADTAIHTDAQGLRHGLVALPVADGQLPAYYAAPADRERPRVILVVQEIFGIHEHIQDICRRFARAGYFAVAPDLYHRQGDPAACADIQAVLRDIVLRVSDEQVLADLDAAALWAAAQGADATRLGVTGFCWGGRLTWMYAAHAPACKAGVAWYGKLATGHSALQTRHPVDITAELHAPVLGLYGGKDDSIPLDDVRRMQDALKQGNAMAQASRIEVYPEAGHGFYADYRPSYRERDAQDAWTRALDWFAAKL